MKVAKDPQQEKQYTQTKAGVKIVHRQDIKSISSILVDGDVHQLGEHRDLRRHPVLQEFLPEMSRLSISWVHLNDLEELKPHEHPASSMIIVCNGSGKITGQLSDVLQEGDIAIIPPYCKHGFIGSGEIGLWALSVQFGEQGGLYENIEDPLVSFKKHSGEFALDDLLNHNQERLEQIKKNRFFTMLKDGTLDNPIKRKAYLDHLEIWAIKNQLLLFTRQSTCTNKEYEATFLKHFYEEVGHDNLYQDRKNRSQLEDPVIEAIASWFIHQMVVLDNHEKAALIHLVIENGSDAYHQAAKSILLNEVNEEYYTAHEADSEHAQMGIDMLKGKSEQDYLQLVPLLDKAWDMIGAMMDRVAELTEKHNRGISGMTIFELDPPKLSSIKGITFIEKKPLEDYLRGVNNTYDILRISSKLYQNETAIEFISDPEHPVIVESYSYIELFEAVNRIARLFLHYNFGGLDVISIILPNLPITQMAISAAEAVAIASPINPTLPHLEMMRLIKLSGSKAVVTTYDIWCQLHKGGVLNDHHKVFICDHHEAKQPNISYLGEALAFSSDQLSDDDNKNSSEVCAFYHTSGTTDSPKLVTLTHFGKVYNAWSTVAMSHYTKKDVIFSAMPYFHVGAPTVTGNAAFSVGAKVILLGPMGWMDPRLVVNFWNIISSLQITRVVALAHIYREILRYPLLSRESLSLTHAISGTSLSSGCHAEFKSVTQVSVQEIYGLTECGCIASSTFINDDQHQGTMGVPYPFMKMTVRNLENTQQRCTSSQPGELYIKGPSVTVSFVPPTDNPTYFISNHWLKTGDVVYKEITGYFHYCHRLNNHKMCDPDHKAILQSIENILLNIPEIKQAAVIEAQKDHPDALQTAYVSFFKGSTLPVEDIIKQVEDKLGHANPIPLHIKVLSHLPVNGMGKVIKLEGVLSDK